MPANLNPNHGMWTRVNRNKTEERSVIDYIMITQQISRYIKMITVDEEGNLRIKGKNETDHNTILMSIKINDPRRPSFQEKWKLNNKEGRGKFNEAIKQAYSNNTIKTDNYQEAEKEIKSIMKNTVGIRKIRTDKTRRTNNHMIKEKEHNETQQKRIPKKLQCRNPWIKGPSQRSLHEKSEGTPLWNRKSWNKKNRRKTE